MAAFDLRGFELGCKQLQIEVTNELCELYFSGIRKFKDIPKDKRNDLLGKLCLLDLSWIAGASLVQGDRLTTDVIKDAIIAQIFFLSMHWSAKSKCSTYEAQLQHLLEIVYEAAERHFSEIIDTGFSDMEEIPEYLDAVLKGEVK